MQWSDWRESKERNCQDWKSIQQQHSKTFHKINKTNVISQERRTLMLLCHRHACKNQSCPCVEEWPVPSSSKPSAIELASLDALRAGVTTLAIDVNSSWNVKRWRHDVRSHEDVGGPLTYLNTCANVNGELFGTEVGEVETVSRVAVRVSRKQFVVVEKR